MIRENTRVFLRHISGQRAFQTVAEISTFHRIQASTGFREAANHCAAKMKKWGFENAEVLSYPAKEDKIFITYPSFQEWDCRGAFLDLVYPNQMRLADFDAIPISVIQKSAPCDYTKEPLELVMLDKGFEEKDYNGVDFEGKLVFVRCDINRVYSWLVEKRGAAGLVTDYVMEDPYVRGRHDQSDTLRYTAFWWKPNQKKAFGFVISPRKGDELAALCHNMKEKGEKILARCKVDSSIYDGAIENVTAFLPGETDEEVLLVGHLCHPRSSANDNASGSACAMEAMKTIRDLIADGVLPPLKRGIRMLLVPEFTGTYAWLDANSEEAKKVRAAFNLDMVGGRQGDGYGPLTITDLPMSTPSFVTDLAAVVLDEMNRQVPGMGPESYCPLFNSHITGYSGGSDHVILSDPMTNIPCLMLGQWPDRFYHTSSDTLDRVDPYILSRSAALAASYAYSLANLEADDFSDLLTMSLRRSAEGAVDLEVKQSRGQIDKEYFSGRLARYTRWRIDSLASVESWIPVSHDNIVSAEESLLQVVSAVAGPDPLAGEKLTLPEEEKYPLIARRLVSTPVQISKIDGFFSTEISDKVRAWEKKYLLKIGFSTQSAVDYYIDGKRTTGQIAREIAFAFNIYNPQAIDEYVKLLIEMGFAEAV